MMIQILLFVFLVGFSAAETQDPIRENFSQFFNAIAVNDTGEISKLGDILRAEVVKQKEAFDAIGRRRTGFILSTKNGSLLVKREASGSLNYETESAKIKGLMEAGQISSCKAQLKFLLRMLVDERADHEKTKTLKAAVEEEKMEYAALTTLRCQMEYLEQTLFPYDIYRNPRSRFIRWMIIMTTPGDDRKMYTEAVLSEFKEAYPDKDDQELKELYANTMQDVYNDLSSVPKSFHRNIDPAVLHHLNEKFSKVLATTEDCIEDKAKVQWYMTLFGLKYEQRYIRALKIVSAERSFTGQRYPESGWKAIMFAPHEVSCLLIVPEDRKDTFPKGVTKEDVVHFFPPTKRPTKVKIDLGEKRKVKPEPIETKQGKPLNIDWADQIIVEFKDYQTAEDALELRQLWLKKQMVQVRPVACEYGDGIITPYSSVSEESAEGPVAA